MKRKIIIPFILIGIMFMNAVCYGSDTVPKVRAKGAVLIEQESGRVLYEKNGYESLAMASTTKIMTCILALEKGKLDDIVTISKRASSAQPVKLHLKTGEKQRLGDLLYALMLQSDNDAAIAIAEHIGDSVESFCEQMTEKAKEIGAESTSFKTPNGLDAEGHYASAYDMALIGAYALHNPEFVRIVTTATIDIPTMPTEGSRNYGLQNKNRFFYSYEGANGVKTGFTNKAGHCFVGAAYRNDMQLVGAALGSGWGSAGKTQKYADVINMMNYGFSQYKKYTLIESQKNVAQVSIEKSTTKDLTIDCEKKVTLPLTDTEKSNIYIKKVVPCKMSAPIHKGDTVGEIQVICEGVILAKAPLVAGEEISKATLFDYIRYWFR